MAPSKKKKAAAFLTDEGSLAPYKVQAKDLIKTSLGLIAAVVGVKHSSKETEEVGTGTLWIDYRWGYRSPIDKDRFEPCHAIAQLWKSVREFEQMLEEEETMREKVHKLNELFKLGLLKKDKKKK